MYTADRQLLKSVRSTRSSVVFGLRRYIPYSEGESGHGPGAISEFLLVEATESMRTSVHVLNPKLNP